MTPEELQRQIARDLWDSLMAYRQTHAELIEELDGDKADLIPTIAGYLDATDRFIELLSQNETYFAALVGFFVWLPDRPIRRVLN